MEDPPPYDTGPAVFAPNVVVFPRRRRTSMKIDGGPPPRLVDVDHPTPEPPTCVVIPFPSPGQEDDAQESG